MATLSSLFAFGGGSGAGGAATGAAGGSQSTQGKRLYGTDLIEAKKYNPWFDENANSNDTPSFNVSTGIWVHSSDITKPWTGKITAEQSGRGEAIFVSNGRINEQLTAQMKKNDELTNVNNPKNPGYVANRYKPIDLPKNPGITAAANQALDNLNAGSKENTSILASAKAALDKENTRASDYQQIVDKQLTQDLSKLDSVNDTAKSIQDNARQYTTVLGDLGRQGADTVNATNAALAASSGRQIDRSNDLLSGYNDKTGQLERDYLASQGKYEGDLKAAADAEKLGIESAKAAREARVRDYVNQIIGNAGRYTNKYALGGGTPTSLGSDVVNTYTGQIASRLVPLAAQEAGRDVELAQYLGNRGVDVAERIGKNRLAGYSNFLTPLNQTRFDTNNNVVSSQGALERGTASTIGDNSLRNIRDYQTPLAGTIYGANNEAILRSHDIIMSTFGRGIADTIQALQVRGASSDGIINYLRSKQALSMGDLEQLRGILGLQQASQYQSLHDTEGSQPRGAAIGGFGGVQPFIPNDRPIQEPRKQDSGKAQASTEDTASGKKEKISEKASTQSQTPAYAPQDGETRWFGGTKYSYDARVGKWIPLKNEHLPYFQRPGDAGYAGAADEENDYVWS